MLRAFSHCTISAPHSLPEGYPIFEHVPRMKAYLDRMHWSLLEELIVAHNMFLDSFVHVARKCNDNYRLLKNQIPFKLVRYHLDSSGGIGFQDKSLS